ncbi:AMP-binding protein [Aeromicrobium sp.]|uniref:AMP-binding protein n=1 Tax=Aeromicrobium sp. TaxID=1871063 RepID=UPI0028AB62F7|nr:AMP-binding protein [Aeromicrobium sp.]
MSEQFHQQIDGYLENLAHLRREAWPEVGEPTIDHPFGETTVTRYLRSWAAQRPEHAAIIHHGRRVTYAELDRASDRVAAHLAHRGFAPGDRAAVMMPNCPQFIIAFFGILKAGGVHVPVNPMFRREEINYELVDSGATFAFILDEVAAEFGIGSEGTAVTEVIASANTDFLPDGEALPRGMATGVPPTAGSTRFLSLLDRDDLPVPADPDDPDALAALNYTGGTTGMPKGCEHTQADMLYTALTGGQLGFGGGPDTVSLVFVPIFWIAGEDAFLVALVNGGTCVLHYRWDAQEVLESIDEHQVTAMAGTVDSYLELLDTAAGSEYSLASMEAPVTMSFVTKLTVEIRERWARETGAPGIIRESSYGMTEDHTLDTFTLGLQKDDADLRGRPGFTGLPMPGTDVAIVDFETGELVPPGGEGQIIVRCPSMMRGYHNRPEATAETLRDGWLHTGDIGSIDETGALHYLGRTKEMLKVNGMSVFPSELEHLFSRHPHVAACGVIGVADPKKGQVPVAYIQLDADARSRVGAEDLLAWCRDHMATYKIPRVVVIDEMPLAPTGKVSKVGLEKLAASSELR